MYGKIHVSHSLWAGALVGNTRAQPVLEAIIDAKKRRRPQNLVSVCVSFRVMGGEDIMIGRIIVESIDFPRPHQSSKFDREVPDLEHVVSCSSQPK